MYAMQRALRWAEETDEGPRVAIGKYEISKPFVMKHFKSFEVVLCRIFLFYLSDPIKLSGRC